MPCMPWTTWCSAICSRRRTRRGSDWRTRRGAARSGDVAAARKDVERLQALKAAMTAAKNNYWAGQTDFQIKTVNGWIALAEKRNDEALQLMQAAAGAEEARHHNPVWTRDVVA